MEGVLTSAANDFGTLVRATCSRNDTAGGGMF